MANFHSKLVLNKYLLSLFGIETIGKDIIGKDGVKIFSELKYSSNEGYNEEGNTLYLRALLNYQYATQHITKEMLQEYDENIVRYTNEISDRRPETIKWKYFQYLSLLFTEVYLEKYFANKVQLLAELNKYVIEFNQKMKEDGKRKKLKSKDIFQAEPFKIDDLNKLAFWNATGSGKTLLMHINIKQYLHYANKYNKHHQNKVLLITPNEGLSKQHLDELNLSDIQCGIFSKTMGSAYSGKEVEILEITKLAMESGDKTVAVDSFETDNLVLVDEGHGGMSGDAWKNFRDKLSETGFAFEYSATFGQAINAAAGAKRKAFEQEYAKSILFDYSYKYFYEDGYGKDYRIMNLKSDDDEKYRRTYLTANLISFYQQQLIFKERGALLRDFMLHKPLWVFVGGRVNAVRTENKKQVSDVLEIIYFLTDFLKSPKESISTIESIISNTAGLVDSKGFSIFESSFNYLIDQNLSAEAIFNGINELVFNNTVIGANLYIDNLKGAEGELGLRVGNTDNYFGVINVGDEKKLFDLAVANDVYSDEKDFSGSLFKNINNEDSKINLLIGSKKFTEGWSSWRVSSMGLMNVGKSEGSQIIQLFGRGVRLKGYNFSLKRSRGLDEFQKPENIREIRKYLYPLETLHIFGVQANYMEQFKEFLEEEGLPTNDSAWTTIEIPTKIKKLVDENRLKLIRVKDDSGFKLKTTVALTLDTNKFDSKRVVVDWYPKIDVLEKTKNSIQSIKNEEHLTDDHLSMLDWNSLYLSMQDYKTDKNFDNLALNIDILKSILGDNTWYQLLIPPKSLEFDLFDNVFAWQQIAETLLKKYIEQYYLYEKNQYNADNVEAIVLNGGDENFVSEYRFQLNSMDDIDRFERYQEKVIELKDQVQEESFDNIQIASNVRAFDNILHLYKPLVYIGSNYSNYMRVSPIALDESETKFLEDLIDYVQRNEEKLVGTDIHVLRNQSRKGLGFFTDGNNFYPDFILWIIKDGKQYIRFIDPKGIRNSRGINDPKIQFHKFLKNKIEPQVIKDNIFLDSFIVSNTALRDIHWKDNLEMKDFNKENVYFQVENANEYIERILEIR